MLQHFFKKKLKIHRGADHAFSFVARHAGCCFCPVISKSSFLNDEVIRVSSEGFIDSRYVEARYQYWPLAARQLFKLECGKSAKITSPRLSVGFGGVFLHELCLY